MAKSDASQDCVNGIGTFKSQDAVHCRTIVRYRPSEVIIKILCQLESKFANLGVCSVNVETLRGGSDKIVEMLELWSIDLCFL